jgi:hypothetical protein
MSDLVPASPSIPAMSDQAIAKVRAFEDFSLAHLPQDQVGTDHLFHAGVYARTITLQPDCHLTGALIKLATVLIVSGDADVYIGGKALELRGYNVIPAGAGRKQFIIARTVVHLTMLFATDAKTVDEAEQAFTDEYDRLFSRLPTAINRIVITGE